MGVGYNPKIVTNGLVLCLDAANRRSYPGSGTTWTDLSGNGNNGTLINEPTYSSGAIVFDGVNDVVTLNTPYNNTVTGLSWSVWFKGVKTADFGYILHNNSATNSTGQSHITIGIDASNRYYGAFVGQFSTMFSDVTQSSSVVSNLVLVWDGTNQNFYVNGVLKATRALFSLSAFAIDTTTALGNYKSIFRPVQGNIYNVANYNRALSAAEITQNFNALRGRYGI